MFMLNACQNEANFVRVSSMAVIKESKLTYLMKCRGLIDFFS